jgi:hypothetical protein
MKKEFDDLIYLHFYFVTLFFSRRRQLVYLYHADYSLCIYNTVLIVKKYNYKKTCKASFIMVLKPCFKIQEFEKNTYIEGNNWLVEYSI